MDERILKLKLPASFAMRHLLILSVFIAIIVYFSAGAFASFFGVQVFAQRPDLEATSVEWQPEMPVEGDEVSFTFTVTNRGKSEATGFTIAVYLDGKRLLNLRRPLGPGESMRILDIMWTATTAGKHDGQLLVDPEGLISESDETNNQLAFTVIVLEPEPSRRRP